MSLNLVNKLERGVVTDPHYSTLSGIARALGVSVQALVREPVLAGDAQHRAGVEDEQRGHDDSRIRRRVDVLESAAELWQRYTDRGDYSLRKRNLVELQVLDDLSLKVVLDHGCDAREMKRACTAEQREGLEQAERRLFDANREFWARVEDELAQRPKIPNIDAFKAQRAEWERASRSSRRA